MQSGRPWTCCWRSPGYWTPVWTWSLCPYAWDCVSKASTQRLCLLSLKNYEKLLNPSRPLKTAQTERAAWSPQFGNFALFLGTYLPWALQPTRAVCVLALYPASPWRLTAPVLCSDLFLSRSVNLSPPPTHEHSHVQSFCPEPRLVPSFKFRVV